MRSSFFQKEHVEYDCNFHVSLPFAKAMLLGRIGLVVSKHGLYTGGPGSIPTAFTTRTAADGDAEHVSLNH